MRLGTKTKLRIWLDGITEGRKENNMDYYYTIFIRELNGGKIKDTRDVGEEELEIFTATATDLTPHDLCRLFYYWLIVNAPMMHEERTDSPTQPTEQSQ